LRETEVSLLLPVHNEAEIIERIILEFYNEIGMKIPLNICVSEDGSTDGTKDVLRQLNEKIPMTLVLGEERKGYMRGVKDGLRKTHSEYVFFVDSDGQHIASDFWKLYEKRKNYDMIVGRKIKRSDPAHRIVFSKVFHLFVRILFRLPLHDPDTAFRLINVNVINRVLEETKFLDYSFWTEFTVRAYAKGFKLAEVPVVHRGRLNGSTRLYNSGRLFSIVVKQLVGLFKLWKEINAQKVRGSAKGLSENRKGTLKKLFAGVNFALFVPVRWQFV